MNASTLKSSRLVVLIAVLLVLLALIAFQAGSGSLRLAAGRASNSPAAISVGQQAAINGAAQLLLLQPPTHLLYLPEIVH